MNFSSPASGLRSSTLTVLLLTGITGATLSWMAWQTLHTQEQAQAQTRFDRSAAEAERALTEAMADYEQLLWAGAALFSASSDVTREDWRAFADSVQLDTRFPGLKGFGFAQMLTPAERVAHEAALRASGRPGYAIRPPGDRDMLTSIVYLEPEVGTNLDAIGYDMYSEPVRRAAMDRAADSGKAALSGAVTLVQDSAAPRPGALMYVPVYRTLRGLHTVEAHRAALRGFVYSPFRMNDLVQAALGDRAADMVVELFDGRATDESALLFERRRAVLKNLAAYTPSFVETRPIEVGMHRWTLRFSTLPAFDVAAPASKANLAGAAGLGLTVLLCSTLAAVLGLRSRAENLAHRMSVAHRESEARMRSVIEASAEGILICDATSASRVLSANPAIGDMLGIEAGLLQGMPLTQLFSSHGDVTLERQLRDIRHGDRRLLRCNVSAVHATGGARTIELAITSTEEQTEGLRLIIMATDLTELLDAQRAARESDLLNQAILEHAPFCVIATDTTGVIQSINPAGERLLGYARHELVGVATPELLHLDTEVHQRSAQLTAEKGVPVRGFEVFVLPVREGDVDEREWTYVRKDGSQVPVNLAINALRDAHGDIHGYIGFACDITERRRTESYVRRLAHHDTLTGLPNRLLLTERFERSVERSKRSGLRTALLMIDLDRFKDINDNLGHHAGDAVLRTVAGRLLATVRGTDTAARLGGDEFVVLLEEVDNVENVCESARKIVHALSVPMDVTELSLTITPSIGIALFPDHGVELEDVLQRADTAMYRTKQSGRNGFTLYQHGHA
ncbi:CHASE domain-containing protein [Methyloversatilis sp.]|uniref:sensor domain-containing diguanylate cyclase n=1 Tax=Methyloversatilis sp. TaxID=2569862 RepID=UPI002733F9C9|nr:CHASE domain-containing protein [Methyloversatilis sp.]MDP3454034.1 CHASE domain-containing protein [Methyloversatilis sp.]MDP3578020.1 CHASE domain-containing protein [Methyloversatilis sp.]